MTAKLLDFLKRFFFHDPGDEASLDQAQRLAKDTNLLTLVAVSLFIIGAAVATLAAWLAWAGTLLLCLAFFGAALLFGFLFGIPKSVANASSTEGTKVVTEVPIAVNTNLEQISDWLTKIIVGLGLVELKQIPVYLDQLIVYVSPLVAKAADAKSLAVNVFMYFSSIGFLTGWVGTRIFLSPLIGRADRSLLPEVAKADVASELSVPTVNVDVKRPPEISQSVDRAANRIITAATLDNLTKLGDILAWAQSQLGLGHFADAVQAYQKALRIQPKDIRVRLGLGVSYYSGPYPIQAALSELLAAQALITPNTDNATKITIYENLAAAYLYTEPPGGYQTSLEYANRALELDPPSPANLYFYMAAAYGQQYSWRVLHGDSTTGEARAKALEYAAKAIDVDPSMRRRLWDLASEPNSIDNDLLPFAHDKDFLRLVGREQSDAPPPTNA